MKTESLKEIAVSSIFWTVIQKYTMLIVNFLSSIVLARLLTPYDYGCIGMLEIFITISTIMIDSGLGSALLQKKRPTPEDYSTIFYWNLVLSIIIYFILFFCAPMIGRFYNISILTKILRIQGIILLINALKMIPSNQLRKQFLFKPMAIITISSSIISIIVTVIMAYNGFGVWALVTQNLLIAALPMLGFWMITKWIPSLVFSKKSFHELFKFGIFMLLTSVITRLSSNIQGLLIGKIYTANTMGYYAKAKSTEGLASNGISQVLTVVTYQLYAEVQDNLEMLANILKRITMCIAYLSFPLIISLMIIARPMFVLLYSEKWLQSVPYFQILAFASFAICMQSVNLQAIAAIGKSKTMFIWTTIKQIINIICIVGGLLLFGIKGLLVGMVISEWIAYFINAWLVSKYIKYSLKKQAMNIFPILLISLVSALLSYSFIYFFHFETYADAFMKLICFVTIYLLVSIILKIEAYNYCLGLLPIFINKIRNKNILTLQK